MKESIAFIFPYYEVSGCPVLFLNIVQKIEELYPDKYDLRIVDYKDGYMTTHLPDNSTIGLIPFKDGEHCLVSTDYVVMQAYLPQAIRPELKFAEKTKVLMWMLLPMNFLPIVFPFNFFHGFIESKLKFYSSIVSRFYPKELSQAQDFLKYLLKINGVVFMNKSDMPAVKTMLGLDNITPDYIPIASSDPCKTKVFADTHNLSFGWVGRLCDFKITILNYTMSHLFDYANRNQRHMAFHVIGTGDKEDILFAMESEYFKIIKVGSLPKNQLDDYMLNHIDVNFAMGTSIIESAKLGIPSVKLDFTTGSIPEDYCPDWFHKAQGYDVGHVINEKDLNKNNLSFDKIVEEFDCNKLKLSEMAISHYQKYFSLSVVTNKLLEALNRIEEPWSIIPLSLKHIGLARKLYYKYKYNI